MKKSGRLLSAALAAALLLPLPALAAPTAERQADLDHLYTTLKEVHPDMFANTPESAFLARKAEIEAGMEGQSDFAFSLDLQSLVALVGDSHTSGKLNNEDERIRYLPVSMDYYGGAWILAKTTKENATHLGSTVTALNGIPMDEVEARFATVISADNEVKLRRQVRQMLYVWDILAYLDLAKPEEDVVLALTDAEGKTAQLKVTPVDSAALSQQEGFTTLGKLRTGKPATALDKTRNYFSLPLDEATYYIQYNQCRNDEALPMKDFAAAVKADLEQGSYGKVVIDLRNNGGGSDGVLMPMMLMLGERMQTTDLQLVALVGESTFSSAIINAVMLQELGAVLVGSPTSGSVDHFGAVRDFALPHSGMRVGYSTKFIDMESILCAAAGKDVETLEPDVVVDQTLADYLAGKDTAVDYILSGATLAPKENPAYENTRAGYVETLWRAAKADGRDVTATGENTFEDAFPYATYLPALNWAAGAGLVQGDGAGAFYPARAITEAEKAIIAGRMNK